MTNKTLAAQPNLILFTAVQPFAFLSTRSKPIKQIPQLSVVMLCHIDLQLSHKNKGKTSIDNKKVNNCIKEKLKKRNKFSLFHYPQDL